MTTQMIVTGVTAIVCAASAVHALWTRRTGLGLMMAGVALNVVARVTWLLALAVAVMIVGFVLMLRERRRERGSLHDAATAPGPR